MAEARPSVRIRSFIGCSRMREGGPDRKSTRLNSSHSQISYAVFCLKKKKKQGEPCKRSPWLPRILAVPSLPAYRAPLTCCPPLGAGGTLRQLSQTIVPRNKSYLSYV